VARTKKLETSPACATCSAVCSTSIKIIGKPLVQQRKNKKMKNKSNSSQAKKKSSTETKAWPTRVTNPQKTMDTPVDATKTGETN